MKTNGWLVICDRCGFKYHSMQLKKEWNGLMTCSTCWEPRHPQDFVKAVPEEKTPPWTRPEATDTYVPICYLDGLSGYAGLGVAGCMIAGNFTYSADFLRGLSTNGH
jgi:hypothetical protein